MPNIQFEMDTNSKLQILRVQRNVLPEVPCEPPLPRKTYRSLANPVMSRRLSVCKSLGFTVLLLNVRSINSREKRAMLFANLERFSPDILALNGTWLDRRDNYGWGGIALLAKIGYEQCIVHVGDSDVTERSWHILHTDRGPMAVALWYRRPDPGEVASIKALDGADSFELVLQYMVFQVTVLGPTLWNIFFADVNVLASDSTIPTKDATATSTLVNLETSKSSLHEASLNPFQ